MERSFSFNSLGQEEELPLRHVWNSQDDDDYKKIPSKAPFYRHSEDYCEILESAERYEDFHTIDWLREMSLNRLRYRQIYNSGSKSCLGLVRKLHDACSGWLVVLLIGLAAGTCAGFIDTTTKWLIDLKFGICVTGFWLNKKSCCWYEEAITTHKDNNNCSNWMSWDQIFRYPQYHNFSSYTIQYVMYVVVGIFFSSLAAVLVKMFAPYACGSGIPEVKTILGGFIIRGYLGKMVLLVKCLTAPLSVASNLSLGKEGPLVHIASCCGNIFAHLFPKYGKNEAKKREVLSAAAAAGVSVAFGVPVGGVLFSLEEVSYYFPMKTMWRSFFCAMVAAFVLRSLNPFGNNPETFVLFYVNYHKSWQLFELVPFAILGILGGLYGAAFVHANLAWCKFRKTSKLGKFPIIEVIIVTLITTVGSFPNPYTRMGATAMIDVLVQECGPVITSDLCDYRIKPQNYTLYDLPSGGELPIGAVGRRLETAIWHLAVALIFKCIITVFTFGLKIPTGLFIPSLGVGALMGRLMGIGVEQLVYLYPDCPLWSSACQNSQESCVNPGLYAMVGAAATLGGVTRMTVSLVVVVYELTGGLAYIVPLMLATMFSKWAGDAFGHEGIYDGHIRLNGYPYLEDKEEFTHTTLAADIMQPRFDKNLKVLVQEDMTVEEVENMVRTSKYNGFPIITDSVSKKLIGYVYRRDLIVALANARGRSDCVDKHSKVYFTLHGPIPSMVPVYDSAPVRLFNIIDLSPITVTDHTPVEIVVDILSKLGVRQVLVTHNGCLLGIITKKDVLRHIAELHGDDPSVFD